MSVFTERLRDDPVAFFKLLWPKSVVYREQRAVLRSVVENDETFVVAGHQLGKDWIAGRAGLWYFLTRHPVRVITTSVKDDHLRVLWGEIGNAIDESKIPLRQQQGGPLVVNHREIKKVVRGKVCKISYLLGMVSEKGEGLAGHHAPWTLLIGDECSGIEDMVYERASTWAKRMLFLGNPYSTPVPNFFRRAVDAGDVPADD